jgi:hypothetical protein
MGLMQVTMRDLDVTIDSSVTSFRSVHQPRSSPLYKYNLRLPAKHLQERLTTYLETIQTVASLGIILLRLCSFRNH